VRKYKLYGGTGYIGSYFYNPLDCEIVQRKDIERDTKQPAYLQSWPGPVRAITANDIVYFLSTTSNYEDWHTSIDTNLSLLSAILISVKRSIERAQNGTEKNAAGANCVFNYVSSWFVYGKDCKLPVNEKSPTNPNGSYSVTKLAAEQMVRSFCELNGIRYRILRLCNVCGGHDPKASLQKNALHTLIKDIKNNKHSINLYHGGNFLRSYMHVKDVCEAIRLVCEKGEVNTIYNIAPDEPSKFIDLMEQARTSMKSKTTFYDVGPSDFHKVVQTKDMHLCNKKLKALGFKQRYTMTETIEELCR